MSYKIGSKVVINEGCYKEGTIGTIVSIYEENSVKEYGIELIGDSNMPYNYHEWDFHHLDILDEEIEEDVKISDPLFNLGDVVEINNETYMIEEIYLYYYDNNSYYLYEVSSVSMDSNKIFKESELTFLYHDTNYESYLLESVKNNLPAWKGEIYNFTLNENSLSNDWIEDFNDHIIPPIYMEHILQNHCLYNRIHEARMDYIFDMELRKINTQGSYEINHLIDRFKQKSIDRDIADTDFYHPGKTVRYKNINFLDEEKFLAGLIDKYDKKDHWPLEMTCVQIMYAIMEAYSTAYKVSKRKYQIGTDKRSKPNKFAPSRGYQIYQETAKSYNDMVIEFWFDFDLNVISTAYPKTNKT